MKRIQHPSLAAAWTRRAGIAFAATCLLGMAACVSESVGDELGTVKYTPGQPITAAPLPDTSGTGEPTQPPGPATSEPPGAAQSDKPIDQPGDTPPPASGGPEPAEPDTGNQPEPEPMDGNPTPVEPEPMAGSGAPAVEGPEPEPDPAEMPPEPVGPGMLTVSFTSAAVGGRYAPRNVGAVWIEDESGSFVKTIERWAGIRAADLRAWNAASGGWGFSFFGVSSGSSADQMDVVTAATLRNHQAHMATWNMKNVDGEVVPDGKYAVVVEVADGRASTARVEFEKRPMPQTVEGNGSVVSNMTVTYSH